LRREMQELAEKKGLSFRVPPPALCTDNAAMIGAAAWPLYKAGRKAPTSLNALPNLGLS
jgi:N6-L-threonylcarbamoyladenine synthase